MSKDVLKLALEALETAHAQTCSVGRPKDWWQLSDAITAIKQALEQPVQPVVRKESYGDGSDDRYGTGGSYAVGGCYGPAAFTDGDHDGY
jgi:hypothetical protein